MGNLVDPRTPEGSAIKPGRLYVAYTARPLDAVALDWPQGYIFKATIPELAIHFASDKANHVYVFEVEQPWDAWNAYAWFVFHQGGTNASDPAFFVGILDETDARAVWDANRKGTGMLDSLMGVPGGLQDALAGAADAIKAAGELLKQMGEAARTTVDYFPYILAGAALVGLVVVIAMVTADAKVISVIGKG